MFFPLHIQNSENPYSSILVASLESPDSRRSYEKNQTVLIHVLSSLCLQARTLTAYRDIALSGALSLHVVQVIS